MKTGDDENREQAPKSSGENQTLDSGGGSDTGSIVRSLRRRWKPIKEGPASTPDHEAIRIRLHRCMSWLQRVEELSRVDADAVDARLIYGWIGLNALYGRWDMDSREPMRDHAALMEFIKRLCVIDDGRIIPVLLDEHKKLVESLVMDEFLNRFYWRNPGEAEAQRTRSSVHRVREMYREKKYRLVLEEVLGRIYVGRCQLVHGGATYGSRLNREPVRRSARMLDLLVPMFVRVIIDGAWTDAWGGVCYPPNNANGR